MLNSGKLVAIHACCYKLVLSPLQRRLTSDNDKSRPGAGLEQTTTHNSRTMADVRLHGHSGLSRHVYPDFTSHTHTQLKLHLHPQQQDAKLEGASVIVCTFQCASSLLRNDGGQQCGLNVRAVKHQHTDGWSSTPSELGTG